MKKNWILFIGGLFIGFLEGAPMQAPSPSFDILRHQVNNHEVEIKTLEQKLENFQVMLETVQDEVERVSALSKEQVKGSVSTLDARIGSLENTMKGITADLQLLRKSANETTTALLAYKKAFLDYDGKFKAQNQNIENLSAALQTVLNALQIKDEPVALSDSPVKTYKIKEGDNLEKIARAHGTTVQAIKKYNLMDSDRIGVGKTLKIPE